MQPTQHEISYLLGGRFHRLAYTAWGDRHAETVVCVHGLSRNGRDFDVLAETLSARFHVLCPDLPGRGRSGWLHDPALYQPVSYVLALSHLLATVGRPVSWIGTSLGGICGMMLAAAANTPIRSMVLNDIGPFLPRAALVRIATYMGMLPDFPDIAALEGYLRTVHAPFGALSDAEWAHLAEHSARIRDDGRVVLHFDPALTVPLREAEPADVDLWPLWDAIGVPMLAIRGENSDLLLPGTFERMGSKAITYEVADAGHAPALMDEPTSAVILDFLTR